ncbi:MAG TPA: phage holin family protein [Lacunisphaera sp.]|jgi:uncharacterized membrane protein YqjE|nr:phage holin family protein [Lacunisphaera sp.]
MDSRPPASPGFLGSFRVLGDSLLAGVQDRLSLLSVELQEEKFRLIRTFLWISAAVFAGVMAIAFASLALVYLFWESARLAVLGGLALFYAVAFGAILLAFRSYLARQPRPFAATLEELNTDRACMRNGS